MENEVIVNAPFESVWDTLVRELSRSFFVINNIDKESRLINVSFSVESPEDYVDCGESHRTYERGSEVLEYNYPIAGSNSYKVASSGGTYNNLPITYYINREARLGGRINIYVAPGEGGTLVSVNCKFLLNIAVTTSWTGENAFGSVQEQGTLPPTNHEVNFSTNQPHASNWGTSEQAADVTCQSSGVLEDKILSMAYSTTD
ncbi:MAG: hypothetical protein KJ970_12055 [Candidatus Eisenbacteria bacterium]|uniref:Uncharacterized protein n=1 Tax=Eiseniibacteriota bacterium TaxID=2212470 RepID=A0A948RVJ3_UNCEI|nr:hypothetical protein [Candidatus Eisenbacteria bacterium]